MWIAKWKWAAAACAALVLTAGGTVAAILSQQQPEPPTAKPVLGLVPAVEPVPVANAPEPKKEPVKEPWEIATAYLQHIIDGKPEQATKLADPKKITERHTKELQVAGLKRAKLAMILVNDFRALVVTERAALVRRPGAEAQFAHAVVQLERKDGKSPWLVMETDIADESNVWREADDYLEGRFNHDREQGKEQPEPLKDAKKQPWDVAEEFLRLALQGKTADALKLTVPGTISENKAGELKNIIFTSATPAAVLINDTRIEVVFQELVNDRMEKGHVVLMLTKSKDGAWQVKDIDFRDQRALEPRVKLYLGGNYDAKAKQ